MSLSGSWNRPKAAAVLANSLTLAPKTFEDIVSTPNRSITDWYATVNAQLRLFKRIINTPNFQGSQLTIVRSVLDYSAYAASTYDPTSITTATSGSFTIANGVPNVEAVNLDAFYTLAGTAQANA